MAEDYKGSITLASIVDGESGQPGRGIDNTVIEYAISSDGSTAPSSGWSTTYPSSFDLGKFLWIRTTVNYTSGDPSISHTVSYKGTNGEDGAPGNSVASISEYYGLSNASTAVPTQWYSDVQTATASNRYLWNYEIVNYTQTASTSTDPKVIGMYSEDGQPGAAGRGISSIINYYLATSSTAVTTASTGWTSTIQTATETKLYLWNYEKITYTSAPTVEYTKPCIISNYAKDGDDGIGIDTAASETKYAVDSQGSTPPSSGWNTSWPSTIPQGSYLWTWVHLVYTDNTSSDEYTVTYQGEDGSERILIESSDEMIYKFYSYGDDVSTTVKSYSPSSVSFWVLETGSPTLLIPGTDYDHELELVGTSNANYKNLWNFFGQVYGLVGPEGAQESKIVLEIVRTIENNQISLNFDALNSITIDTVNTSAYFVQEFQNLVDQLSITNYYLSFKVYNHTNNTTPLTQDLLAQKPIGIEFGTSDDMAQFRLSANSIQQLIRDTKLTFDAEGLHLSNGAFDITDIGYHLEYPTENEFNANKTTYYTYDINTDTYTQCTAQSEYDNSIQYYSYGPKQVFEYDPDLHSLNVYGNGEFTGIIKATGGYFSGDLRAATGSFNGTVTAVDGRIGGWYIGEDGLYSSENFDTAQIRLLSSGSIYANNITLGAFAQIESYIQLGNDDKARLWNPSAEGSNRYILEAGRTGSERGVVHLNEDGVFVLGDITIDGPNSLISGQQLTTNDPAWWINPERAVFNNIVAKGKIVTSVFETGKVQSVGGAMVFKPSYRVVSIDTDNCGAYLEDAFLGSEEDYVYFIDKNGTLINVPYKVEYVSNDKLYIETSYQDMADIPEEASSIIDIGPDQSVIVGINSNENSSALLLSQGLTISEFNAKTNVNDIKAFLGNLGINNLGSGYGLYSDNVYLMGSLTTRTNTTNATYAGVNTLSGVAFNQEGISDTSKIIFWAGSNGIDPQDIQQAPFQVTEAGTIYAKQGTFEGAIISRSRIEGSEIRTAKIYGTGQTPNAGLSIYNAAKAITFYSQSDESDPTTVSEVFSIGTDGFKVGDNQFLNIASNGQVSLNIDSINTNNFTIGGLSFGTNALGNDVYDIEFNDGIHFRYNEQRFLTAVYNKLTVAVDTQISTIFIVGDNILQYKPHTSNSVVNGYDLYVRSAGG